MQNGLYSADFKTPLGAGSGVVMLLDGKLTGGDDKMYYVGTYVVNGNSLTAEVKTGRHHSLGSSVFGKDEVTIQLAGTHQNSSLTGSGTAKEAPGVQFAVSLKLIDLRSDRPQAGTAPFSIGGSAIGGPDKIG